MAKVILKNKKVGMWTQYIWQRIKQNKNFIGFISGPTGSGKSFRSVRIAEDCDPDFNIDRVVFSPKELMKLVNSGELKKGSAIVWEEVGVGAGHRDWQSIGNKVINYLVQTFRHQNIILILNAPYMDFTDASLRKLFHAELSTVSIDYTKKKVRLRPQLIQYNSRKKKFYYKYLRVATKEGLVPFTSWSVGMPSDELLKAYELKKKSFTDSLNKEILAELEKSSGSKKMLTQHQQTVLELLRDGNLVPDVARIMRINPRNVYQAMELAKKKGADVKAEYNGAVLTHYSVDFEDLKVDA